MNDVSVVIPCYNSERLLPETLDSVIAQRGVDWRAIVVDDGSSDATAEIACQMDPRISVLRQNRGGVSRARNAGAFHATSEYLMFLDADDLLHPHALSRLQSRLAKAPAAVAAFGSFDKILLDGSPYPGQANPLKARYPEGDVVEAMLRQNFLANGGHVLIRTEFVHRSGGFDQTLRLSEDWEFWCRLALLGSFIFIGGPPVMALRVHPASTSGALSREWTNHLPALQRVRSNPALRELFAPKKWNRLERAIVASHMWEAGRINFSYRNFSAARHLMLRSLYQYPTLKRSMLFVVAQFSQLLDRSFVSRLRFARDDEGLVQSHLGPS